MLQYAAEEIVGRKVDDGETLEGVLYDLVLTLHRRILELESQVETLQFDVSVLEAVAPKPDQIDSRGKAFGKIFVPYPTTGCGDPDEEY